MSHSERAGLIDTIASLPRALRAAVHGLTDAQLDTPYRDGGWTVRQVVHHVPDSHANAYIRFRLALTEDEPTIRVYNEAKWAELPDARTLPVAPSLTLLEGLHARWVPLLREMSPQQYARMLVHPERGRLSLGSMLRLYDWHSRHHTAHITRLRERMRW
ncbi:MAG: YfiT family bacillithiol transferase [Longimicrobiales bacterium]